MNVVLQHDNMDCGAACLSMIAEFYGLKLSLPKCRKLTNTNKNGCNLLDITVGADQIGLSADALEGTKEELLNSIEKKELTFPFIAHMMIDNTLLHYVVVYGVKNGKFLIADPAKGRIKKTFDIFFNEWTGYVITLKKTEQFCSGNFRISNLKFMLNLAKKESKRLFILFFTSLAILIATILSTLLIALAIDVYSYDATNTHQSSVDSHIEHTLHDDLEEDSSDANDDHIHIPEVNNKLLFMVIVCLYLFCIIAELYRTNVTLSIAKSLNKQLIMDFNNHTINLPIESFASRQSGDYLSRFYDIDEIISLISNVPTSIILDSLMIVCCCVIIFNKSLVLFIITAVMLMLYFCIVIFFYPVIKKYKIETLVDETKFVSHFKECVDGLETIKSNGIENSVNQKSFKLVNKFLNSSISYSRYAITQSVLSGGIDKIGTFIILCIGFVMVQKNILTMGTLVLFFLLLNYLIQSLNSIIRLQPIIQSSMIAIDRLKDIFDLETEEFDNGRMAIDKCYKWEFKNVSFKYGNQNEVLHDINLTINSGEKVAIVGESGSGKTSISKLLMRYYSPHSGSIMMNDIPISEYNLKLYRDCISYINPNSFLFSDSIKNNLRFENSKSNDDEFMKIYEDLRLNDFIDDLPCELDYPLEENGTNLSSGQRQRLSLARGLLKKPQLLILDEATSNMDIDNKNNIKKLIFEKYTNLTCIIITHNLSTISKCDKVYVIDKGCIIKSGKSEELGFEKLIEKC